MTRGWQVRLKILLLLSFVCLGDGGKLEGQRGFWAVLRRHSGTLVKIGKIGGSARKITRDIGQHQKKTIRPCQEYFKQCQECSGT